MEEDDDYGKGMIRNLIKGREGDMIALATASMPLLLLIPNMVNPQYDVSGREIAEPSHLKEIRSKEKRDSRCRLQDRGCSAMIINRPSNHSRLYQYVDRQVIIVICAF